MYDYAVVGGGIAGLYAVFCIARKCPGKRIVLIEAQHTLGGRAKNATFSHHRVVTGAGVARKEKDKLLLGLLKHFNLPEKEFCAHGLNVELRSMFMRIKTAYERTTPKPPQTFEVFARTVLGDAPYQHFVTMSGYSDYEKENIHDVLYNYSFDDNFCNWKGVSVPWTTLINKLRADIAESCTIVTNCPIRGLYKTNRSYVLLAQRDNFYAKKIIIATAADGIKTLLPQFRVYDYLHGQPFLRLYAKVDGASAPRIASQLTQGMTIVQGPLQKMIPIDPEAGVFMVAYCDNANAINLRPVSSNTSRNRAYVSRLVERALGLPSKSVNITHMRAFYFTNGTHYYSPGRPAHETFQRPFRNIYVVGEAVSLKQGWTEGALESVQAILAAL